MPTDNQTKRKMHLKGLYINSKGALTKVDAHLLVTPLEYHIFRFYAEKGEPAYNISSFSEQMGYSKAYIYAVRKKLYARIEESVIPISSLDFILLNVYRLLEAYLEQRGMIKETKNENNK